MGHVELQSLTQQLVAACPLYMPPGRGIVIDLQPVCPQIQHPLHWPMAALHHELVYHLLHKLQTPLGLALGLAAAVAFLRAIVVKLVFCK